MLAQLVRRRGMRNAEALAQLAAARMFAEQALQHRLLEAPDDGVEVSFQEKSPSGCGAP